MKKQILFILFTLFITAVNAQGEAAKNYANQCFNSYEDFVAGKPIEGKVVKAWTSKNVELSVNGSVEKVKIADLPFNWFVNEDGMLMRVYNKELYYVLVHGPISFYVWSEEGKAGFASDGFFMVGKFTDTFPNDFYSLTPNGDIEKLSEGILGKYLDQYGLSEQYDNDPEFKRERTDCVNCWLHKKASKKIKYIQILNEKMK